MELVHNALILSSPFTKPLSGGGGGGGERGGGKKESGVKPILVCTR